MKRPPLCCNGTKRVSSIAESQKKVLRRVNVKRSVMITHYGIFINVSLRSDGESRWLSANVMN